MGARIAAPVAFLLLATLGVVAVREALDEPASQRPAAATTAAEPAVPTETSPPAATGAEEAAAEFYSVRAGDTLASIADRSGTTVERLLDLNPGIDPVALRIGQRIRVG